MESVPYLCIMEWWIFKLQLTKLYETHVVLDILFMYMLFVTFNDNLWFGERYSTPYPQ